MLSKQDNELITNTNAGSPMGELFRRFWLPALLAEELPGPDCAPVRVTLMGEQLVAWRDSQGRIGLLDAYCPHRGAALFFGRNEECGLRCVYHGWKFDVDGRCLDIPNAPEGERLKRKIRIKSYPCVEAGGLVWTYMGPPERKPPFPQFEWLDLPPSHRYLGKYRMDCNYLQAMEGDYDWTHFPFLHSSLESGEVPNPLNPGWRGLEHPLGRRAVADEPFPRAVGSRRVRKRKFHHLEHTPASVLAVLEQNDADGRPLTTVAPLWIMPIFCVVGLAGRNTNSSSMRVPIDNESLMCFRLRWSHEPIPERDLQEYRHGEYTYPALIPGTSRCRENRQNDYGLDRAAQRTTSYSGIRAFPVQDNAMAENQWGPIADRTKEHLTSSDAMIIAVRKRLLAAAKALAKGQEPEAPWHPEEYRYHRWLHVPREGTLDEAVAIAKKTALRERCEMASG